ncbi:MAG: proton-dependent oligopeptide transporter, family [Sphingomonadales bacterium]|nr:proton-dependent oligopeptide transporter, family [Sphingomonadales bacterium]
MVNIAPETTTEGERPNVSRSDADTWFGHPRQLARLFTTEMWERFGYYGMRALLVLFLTQHFLFGDSTANGLYGAFTSLVYLTPLIGGLVADRFLGSKRSVKLGALLMSLGYLGLCFNGPEAKPFFDYGGTRYEVQVERQGENASQYVVAGGQRYQMKGNEDGSMTLMGSNGTVVPATVAKGQYETGGTRDPFFVMLLLFSLSSVIVGNGLFKPNISTIVGSLYDATDSRRDAGFTIFYMGINLGSLISQFFCPLLAVWFGWWAGFGLAAFGMLIAWALFQFDGGRLDGYGEPPAGHDHKTLLLVTLGALAMIPVAWFLLNNTMANAAASAAAAQSGGGILGYIASLPILGQVMFWTYFAAVIGIPIWAYLKGSREEFHMMVVAVILTVFSTVFWTLFEQAGSSLTLFADRNTDRQIGGYLMPAGQTQIFNPIFIVLLAPLFSMFWVMLARKRLEPSIPVKFAIGLTLVGAGFLVLVFGSQFAGADFKVPLIWLALAYLIHSIGELCLSPVGLSMITKLSIARVVGLMMGVWFLSSSMAQYVGGVVAQFASVETVGGEVTNPALSLSTYMGVFQTIGLVAIGIGVFLFLLSFLLKKWMHGVN